MVWVKKEFPYIPSLEDSDLTYAKRFVSCRLDFLIKHRLGWIMMKMNELGISSAKDAIEFVIVNIDYPLYLSMPDDKHVWNAFHGKSCYTINLDFWQSADETLMTYILNKKFKNKHGYGDCEDTSILTVALLRALKVNAYEILGAVYEDDKLLGGHGFLIAKLDDNKWHLIESTMDNPLPYPNGYPVINPKENRWKIKNYVYEGWIKFNDLNYYEWNGGESEVDRFKEYIRFDKKMKHYRKKIKKIKDIWNIIFKEKTV